MLVKGTLSWTWNTVGKDWKDCAVWKITDMADSDSIKLQGSSGCNYITYQTNPIRIRVYALLPSFMQWTY